MRWKNHCSIKTNMDLFVIDTHGSNQFVQDPPEFVNEEDEDAGGSIDESDNDDEGDQDFGGLPPPSVDVSDIISSAISSMRLHSNQFDVDLSIKKLPGSDELRLRNRDVTLLDEIIADAHVKLKESLVPIEQQNLELVALSNRKLLKMRRVSVSDSSESQQICFSLNDDVFDT